MALQVKLEAFEGPLDLLLYLIEKNKVDIYDIPIVSITEQYLDFIKKMETEDMNVMSEFLVMAATLLDIKSKMLLPKELDEESGEEIDPRAELVQQLLEYKMCKYMAYELKDRQMDASHTYFKPMTMPKEIEDYKEPVDLEQVIGDATLTKLQELFNMVMKRQEDKIDPVRSTFGNIKKEEVDIENKAKYISIYISAHGKCSFVELLERQRSKAEIIVSFLIILEMMKIGQITIVQDDIFGDIMIQMVPDFKAGTEIVFTAG